MRSTIILLLFVLLSQASFGQIIHVPADRPSIQAAVDSAVTGDTVLVADGIYSENLVIQGKSIVLGSHFLVDGDTSHIAATIIDGSQPVQPDSGSVLIISGPEASGSVISGFTITGGSGTVVTDWEYQPDSSDPVRAGGGLLIRNARPVISFNQIVENAITDSTCVAVGAGLAADGEPDSTKLVVHDNTVSRNRAEVELSASGGGMFLKIAAVVRNNTVSQNRTSARMGPAVGGGLVVVDVSGPDISVWIEENDFISNTVTEPTNDRFAAAGGVAIEASTAFLLGNTIADNSVSGRGFGVGAGIAFLDQGSEGSALVGNTVERNVLDAGFGLGGGVVAIALTGLEISGNRISHNRATAGGGLSLDETNAIVRQNYIVENVAEETGGGILIDNVFLPATKTVGWGRYDSITARLVALRSVLLSPGGLGTLPKTGAQRPELVNNTIAYNEAMGGLGAGGIGTVRANPTLRNSIVWGNSALISPQIAGALDASYSIVEGGMAGMGNLDSDPEFSETTTYYLSNSSPAVDAGNPDSVHDDVEDPLQTGMAQFPALGTIRNDMGATGGPVDASPHTPFLGPTFAALMGQLENTPNPQDQQALVDSFMTAIGSTPFIDENNVAYFLYRGAARKVTVPGDANWWIQDAFPMARAFATNLWYREMALEADARLDYKFVVDGTWLMDPENPRTVLGGFGPNSELAMPGFEHPVEIDPVPGIPTGTLTRERVESAILGNARTIEIYTPAGYDPTGTDSLPVIYFHDGTDYTRFGSAKHVLDNLIAQERIEPVIALFVPPRDRANEYVFDQTDEYEQFVVNELMPFAEARYRIMQRPEMRAMTGPSFGGVITTQICYNRPTEFGKCAPISSAYWPKDFEVFNMVAEGPPVPVQWYFDWGSYEFGSGAPADKSRALAQILIEKGAGKTEEMVTWNEWHDGHSWGNWRAHMKEFLILFFPGRRWTGFDDESIPSDFALHANYPNPFNPETTIGFSMPSSARVSLKIFDVTGRLVAELADTDFAQGSHELRWNATGLASGVYVYRLEAGTYSEARTLVVMK